ncbi:MAG: hypothetical protein AAFV29_21445 [Myxococcota bacterium]
MLYDHGKAIWNTGTSGATTTEFVLDGFDGDLKLRRNGAVVWNAKRKGGDFTGPGGFVAVQNDGNLVGYTADRLPVWRRQFSSNKRGLRKFAPLPRFTYYAFSGPSSYVATQLELIYRTQFRRHRSCTNVRERTNGNRRAVAFFAERNPLVINGSCPLVED